MHLQMEPVLTASFIAPPSALCGSWRSPKVGDAFLSLNHKPAESRCPSLFSGWILPCPLFAPE